MIDEMPRRAPPFPVKIGIMCGVWINGPVMLRVEREYIACAIGPLGLEAYDMGLKEEASVHPLMLVIPWTKRGSGHSNDQSYR